MEIIIPKIKFEYAASAASTDPHRPILTGLCLCSWKGSLWLMATDVHRIHAVKLKDEVGPEEIPPLPGWKPGPQDPEDWIPHLVFPPRRVIFELKYWKRDFIRISFKWVADARDGSRSMVPFYSVGRIRNLSDFSRKKGTCKPSLDPVPEYEWQDITHPETLEGNYPSLGRVLGPEGEGACLESLCINSKYFVQACAIADTAGGPGKKIVIAPTEGGRIKSPCRSLYVKPCLKPAWESTWFALIMPMAALDKEVER